MDLGNVYESQLEQFGFVPINHDHPNFFPVALQPVFGIDHVEVPGVKQLVRTDTGKMLKVHTDAYGLIPYEDVFNAFDTAIQASELDTTGMMVMTDFARDGARCFRQYVLPAHLIEVSENETLALRIIMFNSYDGSQAFSGRTGGYRFVCANTCVIGTDIMKVSVKHTKNAALKIEGAIEAIVQAAAEFAAFEDRITLWRSKTISESAGYDAIISAKLPTAHRDKIFCLWRLDERGHNDLWGLYNGLTSWATHNGDGALNKPSTRAQREALVANIIECDRWRELEAA